MSNSLICTVGTSLLGNLQHLAQTPEAQAHGLTEQALRARNAVAAAKYLQLLDPTARECGAEINSITSLQQKGYVQTRQALHCLVSDTDDGQFIGDILRHYYRDACDAMTVRRVEGLHDKDFKAFRTRGLRHLVRDMADCIKAERRKGRDPIINATGGFKAQISFAGLIGQVLGVPVYYMFERFAEVIEMPPMPVAFDFSLWLEYFDLLEALSRGDMPASDERFQRVDPRLDPLLFRVDDDVTLSAMGELFHEGFLHRFAQHQATLLPPASAVRPEDKPRLFGKDHHRPSSIETYFGQLARVPYVTRLQTFYSNLDLAEPRRFWLSSRGFDRVEGCYSDGKGTCRFNVYLTSSDRQAAQAAVVDLSQQFGEAP
jgi:putative CRISPR-associated protein (TIGR02619 family)